MRTFARAVSRLSDLAAIVAALLLTASVLAICYMIVNRAFGNSSFWEVEASIYMMVGATFLASPYTLRTGGHVGVELVPDLLPARARSYFLLVLRIVGMAVCLYLAWEGVRLTEEAFLADERSISMWRPARWPMFAMMPIGMGLTALQYFCIIIDPELDQPERAEAPVESV